MGFFVANSNIGGFCILKGESLGNFISECTREMTESPIVKLECGI